MCKKKEIRVYTPYATEWMTITEDGVEKSYLVVTDNENNGRVIPLIAEVLIEYQEYGQRSGKEMAYYARVFLDFLYTERKVRDLGQVTTEDTKEFAKYLRDREEKKSYTIREYSFLIDKIFDNMYDKNLLPKDSGLVSLEQSVFARSDRKKIGMHRTFAGSTMREVASKMPKKEAPPTKSRTKAYSCRGLEIIENSFASLRDRCIWRIMYETGYRFDSTISIDKNIDLLQRECVSETRSKTGLLHDARIDKETVNIITTYINKERKKAVEKAGFDCGKLFIILKGKNVGKPMNYHAFYSAARKAKKVICNQYPGMTKLGIYPHGARATYLNNLIENSKDENGNIRYPASEISRSMDWRSMAPLENYLAMQCNSTPDEAGIYANVTERMKTEDESSKEFAVS